jgi:hypothetical protein
MITPPALLRLLLAVLAAAWLVPGAAIAKPAQSGVRTVVTTSWVEEWDPAAQRWVRVEDGVAAPALPGAASTAPSLFEPARADQAAVAPTSARFTFAYPAPPPPAAMRPALAQYGPFRVLDESRAALVGSTDITSPRQFDAMLRDYPGLAVLEMIDAPGTSHDLANLALGRRIRAAGLETHVPARGSVRSGAVELFLAGKRQTIAPGATFAVHSWLDSRGLEPRHFAEDAPENRLYLDYYTEMGMTQDHARAFYAMTNSVPHSDALWLDAVTMQRWIAPLTSPAPTPLTLASVVAGSVEPHRDEAFAGEAQWVWETLMQGGMMFAAAAPAPRLDYAELLPVTLARLDSAAAFP